MTLLGRKFLKKGRQAIGRQFFRMGASRPADNFVFILQKLDKETLQNFYHFMFKNV